MAGRFLLDTNTIISLFKRDKNVHSHLTKAEEIFIPSVSVGELYYGAFKSTKVDANIKEINRFLVLASQYFLMSSLYFHIFLLFLYHKEELHFGEQIDLFL